MNHKKLKLYGFNNLTKSLSFNIYDICYAESKIERQEYIEYIDDQYNSERLTSILYKVSDMIGAHVINVSQQDYDPQGASVTFLISEKYINEKVNNNIICHLDKSHVTVHTYPEYHPDNPITTFRVDIDIATCGKITPLRTLDFLINSFDSDIIIIDYKIRGFTRNVLCKKLFIDHKIFSIQDYINKCILEKYNIIDINIYQENIFHTKMMIKDIDLKNYLFKSNISKLNSKIQNDISMSLKKEMMEIFTGKNIF